MLVFSILKISQKFSSVKTFAKYPVNKSFTMDLSKIQNLVNIHSEEIQLTDFSGKSIIWKSVYSMKYNNEPIKFVCCKQCKKVMPYNSKSGTGNISKHISSKCNKEQLSQSMKITSFFTNKN